MSVYGVVLASEAGRRVMVLMDPLGKNSRVDGVGRYGIDLDTGEMVDLWTGRSWMVMEGSLRSIGATADVGDTLTITLKS